MKSKAFISLVASSLIVNFSFGAEQSISLSSGWNLAGSNLNGNISSDLKVFKYKDGVWSSDYSITAGSGFWVKSTTDSSTLKITGESSTSALEFSKSGWYLSSPITTSLNLSAFTDSSFSEVYAYKNGKWSSKTKGDLVSLSTGDGFWVKTGKDGVSLKTVVSGSVDLAGLYEANTSRNRDAINPITGEVIPDSASVQLYDANDTDYQEPLLSNVVAINPITGEYIVSSDNFVDSSNADNQTFIVRVIAEKDGKKFDMSAIKTSKDSSVQVNPITTAIKTQILSTLKNMFGADLKIEGAILEAVDTLASTVAKKVKEDIKNSKLSLRQDDFITTKSKDELTKKDDNNSLSEKQQKESKLQAQLDTSTASKDLTKFKSDVSYVAKSDVNLSNINFDNGSTDIQVARLEYDTVSSLARMDLAVHDGKGRVVLFLPVAPEDFDKLPGSQYQVTVNINGTEEIIGNDPAIRVVDISKDLQNATGTETWASKLLGSILETPIVSLNIAKSFMQNEFKPTQLVGLGELLKTLKNESGTNVTSTNPFDISTPEGYKDIVLSSDVDTAVKKLIEPRKADILLANLKTLQNSILLNAINNKKIDEFVKNFDGSITQKKFIETLANSYEFETLLTKVGVPLIEAIPSTAKEDTTLRFEDNFKIGDTTTIYPKTGLALSNLVVNSSNLNLKFTQKTLKELVGSNSDLIKDYETVKIWWVEETQNTARASEDSKIDNSSGMLSKITKQLTGEDVKSEARFQDVVTDVKNFGKKFENKYKEREKNFFNEQLVSVEEIDSTVSFELLNESDEVITTVKSVKFIPHIKNKTTKEIIPLRDKAVEITGNDGRFSGIIHIYTDKVAVDKDGNKATDGGFSYIEDYNLEIVLSSGESFNLGHPISLYPLADNNLNTIYLTSVQLSNPQTATDKNTQSESFLESGKVLKYPLLNKDILTFVSNTLKASTGVKLGIVASNQTDIEKFWSEAKFAKPTDSTLSDSISTSSLVSGSLIYAKISDKSQNGDILIQISSITESGIKLSITNYPKSISNTTETRVPTCTTTDGKSIELTKNSDGTYPYPKDANYPKECLTGKLGNLAVDSNKTVAIDCSAIFPNAVGSMNGGSIWLDGKLENTGSKVLMTNNLQGNSVNTACDNSACTQSSSEVAPLNVMNNSNTNIAKSDKFVISEGNHFYNDFTINSGGTISVTGKAVVHIKGNFSINGNVNSDGQPENLLFIYTGSGDLSINSGANVNAYIYAPNGAVYVNGQVSGSITAHKSVVNGSGVVKYVSSQNGVCANAPTMGIKPQDGNQTRPQDSNQVKPQDMNQTKPQNQNGPTTQGSPAPQNQNGTQSSPAPREQKAIIGYVGSIESYRYI